MRWSSILFVAVLLLWPGHIAAAGNASNPVRARTGPESIHKSFVSAISAREYESALAMLHPKLSREWTLARFTRDWTDITDQAASEWSPEMTGAFTGTSPQGVYQQATFRLVSDWQSVSSVDLTSIRVDGTPRIVQIQIRVPHRGAPPGAVEDRTDQFIAAMQREDYDAVRAMLDASLRQTYAPSVLAQLKPLLGPSPQNPPRTHYRLSANTVWYDAVRLGSVDDPMTFLELVMDSTADPVRIVSLSFRGRIGR